MDFQTLLDAHEHCFCNRAELERDQLCGCAYCGNIFRSSEIEDWTDFAPNETALCPECYVDAVVPESAGIPITKEFLNEMYETFFGGDAEPEGNEDDWDDELGAQMSLHARLAYCMP